MTILEEIQTSISQHAEGAGSSVVGIGQRWGGGSGIVLAEGRVLTNAHNVRGRLERTAPLLPGSSGGPVLDAGGRLLGINTNRLGEGFYLAIPADEALRAQADTLARGESAAPPRLGIAIAPRRMARRLRRAVGLPDTEGLLIQQVAEDSPAACRGPSPGDLIVAAAGQPVGGVDDLFGALQGAQ